MWDMSGVEVQRWGDKLGESCAGGMTKNLKPLYLQGQFVVIALFKVEA